MTFLRRRIEHLLSMRSAGRLLFAETLPRHIADTLKSELAAIKRDQAGEVELNSCGPLVRSFARMIYSVKDLDPHTAPTPSPTKCISPKELSDRQKQLFSILDEFFKSAVGLDPAALSSVDEFDTLINTDREKIASRAAEAFSRFGNDLHEFHCNDPGAVYEPTKQLGGVKLVIGGSQRFTEGTLDAVRSMLLYADTLLIPDPVLPWFERERTEEQFRHILPLQATFLLLQLKPLVDADLSAPAITVFPSWEKVLEADDEHTQDGLSRLYCDFFSHYLDTRFDDKSEILEYANSHSSDFLQAVERRQLFVAPGGSGDETAIESVRMYRDYITTWWSEDVQTRSQGFSDSELVARGILDRLVPQYHLRENADALEGHPMLWLAPHWHYFQLCSGMTQDTLKSQRLLNDETVTTIRALRDPELRWLGNVPIHSLVQLRRDNQNVEFRRRLSEFVNELHDSSLANIDRVASQVSRGILSLIQEHQAEIETIEKQYNRRHTKTALSSWVTFAATFLPWLGPFVPPIAALAAGGKYASEKWDELADKRRSQGSLAGVLAAANDSRG